MQILITGGAGFVGSVLTPLLLQDYKVKIYDMFYFRKPKEQINLILKKGDTRNIKLKDFEGIDAVIDLAALAADNICDLSYDLSYQINVEGALRVAEMAKKAGVKRYIYSSTCSVYGGCGDENLTERSPVGPISIYAKSKLAAETEILNLNDNNFKVVAIRNGTMFGYSLHMRFDLIVNTMSKCAWFNGKVTVNGGLQWRPNVHLSDVARAFKMFLENNETGIFNLGGYNHRVLEVANMVKDVFCAEVIIKPANIDKRNYNVNSDKIKALGFEFKTNVYQGIQEIKWALDTGIVKHNDPKTITIDWYKKLIKEGKLK